MDEELFQELREQAPPETSDDEIRAIITEFDGDKKKCYEKLADLMDGGEGAQDEEEAAPSPRNNQQEDDTPKEAPNEDGSPRQQEKKRTKSSSKRGSQDKEMMDFRHLMVKGLELKRFRNGSSEKCVIYMDVTCRTFFCAKQKNAASAKAYRVEDITEAAASASNEKIIAIMHKEGQVDLEVSSPKVRDYLVRMLNKLFSLEKNRSAEDVERKRSEKTASRPERGERSERSSEKADRSDRGDRRGSGKRGSRHDDEPRHRRTQVSQVRLLAEHCYSMSDDKIEEMVTAKIPTHSRWESYQEFKDKINRRDELIRSLQDGLGTINSERVRFQRACEDIELHHQDELQELKQHLAMALQSFQELQRASEHRESEMREALKGAMERSQKFEDEKQSLMESMNDQRVNAAASEKEVEMLNDAMKKQAQELEKKTAECEDTRKRFSQVKEALTVERNLRARAEIKEEQMRQETIALTGQMHAVRDKLQKENTVNSQELNDRTADLEKTIEDKTAELEEINQKFQTLTEETQEKIATMDHEIKRLEGEVEGLNVSLSQQESSNADQMAQLAKKAGLVDGLESQIAKLQREKEELIQRHAAEVEAATTKSAKIEEELRATIADQEQKLVEADETRRKMHNIIQELRGNIRVYIRVRPFLPGDGVDLEGQLDSAVRVQNDNATAEIVRKEDGEVVERHKWTFDKSFPCATSQDEIFLEVSEFVQSALDGYNVCLFSYGQTGSGKTHTMQGYGRGEMAGIIPRAIAQIGRYRDATVDKGWVYQMDVTFIEIYNEVVYDLLRPEGSDKESLDIKQDNRGKTYVQGATKLSIDPADNKAIDDLMDTAALHRQTASTNMNAQSSRSHSIFTLYLEGINEEMGARVKGTLHLCDLAGSERISRSGAEGDRLKEAVNINKSLSCLTDVFNALGNKQAFIPFRNSKLTYFLQPALSGDGKTMMFVNLSPTDESYFESLCSLRFASNVNQVELGKAQRNVVELPLNGEKKAGTKSPKSASKPDVKTPTKAADKTPPKARGAAASRAGARKK